MSTVCPLPFVHLATHPEGKVTLCCISDHTNNMSAAKNYPRQLLNLNRDSIVDIVNSDYFKEVRSQMIAGEKPLACMRCYKEEEQTGQSKRLQELKRFGFNAAVDISPNFKFVELRLGNLCNVRCRTCNPYSSSQWISEYSKLQAEINFVTNYDKRLDFSWIDSDSFWNELFEYSTNLELIYINGGEPTLVKKHWTYLDRLIEKGLNKKVTLWYNINMTNVPDELINIWKKFKKVIIHASIDDLKERNSYIRKGTDWQTVENNLQKLKNNSWIDLQVTQTVSWLNVFYIDEFIKYFKEKGISTHFNLVHDPKFLSPIILPQSIKNILFEKLKNFRETEMLISNIRSGENIDLFHQGILYNDWLDKSRKENFLEIFPEWADHLNYKNLLRNICD